MSDGTKPLEVDSLVFASVAALGWLVAASSKLLPYFLAKVTDFSSIRHDQLKRFPVILLVYASFEFVNLMIVQTYQTISLVSLLLFWYFPALRYSFQLAV